MCQCFFLVQMFSSLGKKFFLVWGQFLIGGNDLKCLHRAAGKAGLNQKYWWLGRFGFRSHVFRPHQPFVIVCQNVKLHIQSKSSRVKYHILILTQFFTALYQERKFLIQCQRFKLEKFHYHLRQSCLQKHCSCLNLIHQGSLRIKVVPKCSRTDVFLCKIEF